MKFAVIADVHANLEALKAVLGDAQAQQCSHHVFLGDFVGYGPDPKACLDLVRGMHAPCVKGNHDEYCATDFSLDGLNPNATRAIEWTRKQLSKDDCQWLHDLPYVRQVEGFTIVHATLDQPERWQYVFDKLAAVTSLNLQNTDLCFFGHTHVPIAFVRDTAVRGGTYTMFGIERGKRYFINPGSVGQPRDKNPKAAYVVYDMDNGTVELRRKEYDIATTQRKIREAGLE